MSAMMSEPQQQILHAVPCERCKVLRAALSIAIPFVAKLSADIPEGMIAQKETMRRVLDRLDAALEQSAP